MTKRTKLGVVPGWPGDHVEYIGHFPSGDMKGLCSVEEWAIWELKVKLVALGAPEADLDELEHLAWSCGAESARMDYEEGV